MGNWNKIQKCLSAHGNTRELNRERVVRAKFQDNLECLQWFKHFFEHTYDGSAYDARARRAGKSSSNAIVLYWSDDTMSLTDEVSQSKVGSYSSGGGSSKPKSSKPKSKKPRSKKKAKSPLKIAQKMYQTHRMLWRAKIVN